MCVCRGMGGAGSLLCEYYKHHFVRNTSHVSGPKYRCSGKKDDTDETEGEFKALEISGPIDVQHHLHVSHDKRTNVFSGLPQVNWVDLTMHGWASKPW